MKSTFTAVFKWEFVAYLSGHCNVCINTVGFCIICS